jgi:GT2 family glycosyltransferase
VPDVANPQSGKGAVRIFAVIVLYKTEPQSSVSLRTLRLAERAVPTGRLKLEVLLHDNTPGVRPAVPLENRTRYLAASGNAGLAQAYNGALATARNEGYDWLLTLDQDTVLPADFLGKLVDVLAKVANTPAIASVVPQIVGEGRRLSPYWFQWGAFPRWFPKGFVGVPEQATYAFNSASTIRVGALQEIGGYCPMFWLDNSDTYMFRRLDRKRKKVYVAGDIQVEHEFSMMQMEERISLDRYRNILLAESSFWDLEMGMLAGLERTARVALRIFKHFSRGDSREHRALTYEFLWRRLFWTRNRRIAAWKRETIERFPGLLEDNRIPNRQ